MNEVVYICFGIAILIIIALLFLRYFLKGKSEADKFLDDLSKEVYELVLECIAEIDVSKYKDIADFIDYAIEKAYNTSWEFIKKKIDENESKDIATIIAKKILTKEYIEKFVKIILDANSIDGFAQSLFLSSTTPEAIEEIQEIDKQIEDEMSDETNYYQNDDDVQLEEDTTEVTEYTEENYSEEELERIKDAGLDKINPPSDDEDDALDSDIMEVMEE